MRAKFMTMFFLFVIVIMGASFALPYYPVLIIPFVVLCTAAPLTMIFMLTRGGNTAEKLLKNGGIKTTAKITNIEDTGITLNRVNIGVRLTLDVVSLTGSAFVAQAETFVSRVAIPRIGDVVEIVYNPADTTQVALVMA